MGRVPIHSCDFSLSEYSYDEYDGDFDLVNFTLVSEDLDLKVQFNNIGMADIQVCTEHIICQCRHPRLTKEKMN